MIENKSRLSYYRRFNEVHCRRYCFISGTLLPFLGSCHLRLKVQCLIKMTIYQFLKISVKIKKNDLFLSCWYQIGKIIYTAASFFLFFFFYFHFIKILLSLFFNDVTLSTWTEENIHPSKINFQPFKNKSNVQDSGMGRHL